MDNEQPLQSAIKTTRKWPLLTVTILLLLGCILTPFGLFMGMFNDTGNKGAAIVAEILIAVFPLALIAHSVVTMVSKVRGNASYKALVYVDIATVGSCLLLVAAGATVIAVASGGTTTGASVPFLIAQGIASLLVSAVIPGLVITNLVLSFMLVFRKPASTPLPQ